MTLEKYPETLFSCGCPSLIIEFEHSIFLAISLQLNIILVVIKFQNVSFVVAFNIV